MAFCPNCRAEMSDDFGLQTCPSCKAQVFAVTDDGPPPIESQMASPPPPPADVAISSVSFSTQAPVSKVFASTSQLESTPANQEELDVKTNLTKIVDELSQVLVGEMIPSTEGENNLNQSEKTYSRSPESKPVSADMADVAEFANSEASQGRDGMLRFNLFISGIDTTDIRNEIKDILSDAKFRFDYEKAISSIRNGELHIKDFSAIKATLLVQRLRFLPVEVRWEQYAIHQA